MKRENIKENETKPSLEAMDGNESEIALSAQEDAFLDDHDNSWMLEF